MRGAAHFAGALAAVLLVSCASSPMQPLDTDCPGYLRLVAKGRKAVVTTNSGEHLAFVVSRVSDEAIYGIDDDPTLPLASIASLALIKSDIQVAGESLVSFTPIPLVLDGAGRLAGRGVDAAGQCKKAAKN